MSRYRPFPIQMSQTTERLINRVGCCWMCAQSVGSPGRRRSANVVAAVSSFTSHRNVNVMLCGVISKMLDDENIDQDNGRVECAAQQHILTTESTLQHEHHHEQWHKQNMCEVDFKAFYDDLTIQTNGTISFSFTPREFDIRHSHPTYFAIWRTYFLPKVSAWRTFTIRYNEYGF